MLKEGDAAPNFRLHGSDKKEHSLSEFGGRYLILYFYPRDNTVGCNIEARGFNESLTEIRKLGAEVVGISDDSLEAHDKFRDMFSLKFLLLSDVKRDVIKLYDAYGNKGVFGMGTVRKTYMIDKNGRIVKIFQRVKPIGHAKEVIGLLKDASNLLKIT